MVATLHKEGAPESDGNTAAAKEFAQMFVRMQSLNPTKPPAPKAGASADRKGIRVYYQVAAKQLTVFIDQDGIDRLPMEDQKFYLGFCMGMANGAARRVNGVEKVAVALIDSEGLLRYCVEDLEGEGASKPAMTREEAKKAILQSTEE